MKKTSKVSIDVYDADGELCESIGGPMNYEDVREQMIEILRNDGIPVLHVHGKHEPVAQEGAPIKSNKQITKMDDRQPEIQSPLVLSWEFEGIKFHACGMYDDVMDAQAEFLQAIMEEE